VIDAWEPGRFIEFRRDEDWWGEEVAINRGLHNFDRLRFEYFRNADGLWEAVRGGEISVFADPDPVRWVEGYDFAAAADGTLQRAEIAHQRPTGMEGFVFNTRRPIFADRRVREALALTFDWEWVNSRLFRGGYARIGSYFDNSPLGFEGPAEGREREILLPFVEALPEGALEGGWRPPASDGSGRDRRNLRRAGRLLDEAGWRVGEGGIRRNAEGRALGFEILVASARDETLASLWRESLARIGVPVTVRLVDEAQFTARRADYDYDMIVNRWAMSLSPGTEQRLYFGSAGRETPGTRNYMGVADPAVDAAIEAILAAEQPEDFRAAVRALDRVLSAGVYVIPFGVLPQDRIAWRAGLGRPERDSLYGWWGWWAGPAAWWREPPA
jgi:peptide/nickel transport system substrate-binding protein